jgi:hypothetical protein
VSAALRAVAGVEQVEVEPGQDGNARYIVSATRGEPTPAALAAVVVGGGWGLIELRPLAMSLEDLYVRLVAPPDGPRHP